MIPTDLDDRIRDVVTTLARSAPDPFPFDTLGTRSTSQARDHRQRHSAFLAVGAALVVVLAGTGLALALRTTSARPPSGDGGAVTARHQVIEYEATPNQTCRSRMSTDSGKFFSSRIETWLDRTGARSRMKTTYPDGSTRDLVTSGSPPIPDSTFERGKTRSRLVDCGLGWGTYQDPGSATFIAPLPDGLALRQRAEHVPGTHRDSLGRPAALWTMTTTGSLERPEGALSTREKVRLFVDPSSDQVLEYVVTTEIGDGSTVDYRTTLVSSDSARIPASTFSTVGYHDVSAQHTTATTTQP